MPSSITSNGGFISILDLLERISESDLSYTASLLLHLVYGHRASSTDDKYIRMSEAVVRGTLEGGVPGSQVVDFFPARELSLFFASFVLLCSVLQLKGPSFAVKYIPAWLPGMAFKRHALRARKDIEGMRKMLFDVAKKYIVSLPQLDIHETSFSSSNRN
jgi:hypothetical protein